MQTETKEASTAPVVLPQEPTNIAHIVDRERSVHLALDAPAMVQMEKLAELMAKSKFSVPEQYQNKPGDCLAVIMQSIQWNMNPFAVAQKTFFVSGKIGYEAQLVSAVITSLAPTKDRLHYEWFGKWEKIVGKFKDIESKTKKDDDGNFKKYRVPAWNIADEEGLGVKCWATMKGETEPRVLEIFMTQARTRNSTLWTDDPKQQIAYLVTKRWARLFCPDVILGVYTPDELQEIVERDITPEVETVRKSGAEALKGATAPKDPPPTIEDVIAAIDAMVNKEQRQAANLLAGRLLDPAAIKRASEAYKARLDWLKANPPTEAAKATSAQEKPAADASGTVIDNETGEVLSADAGKSGAPTLTYAQVEEKIRTAKDEDALAIAADLIQHVSGGASVIEDLNKAYKKRVEELKDA